MAANLPALSLGNAIVRQLDGLFNLNDLHAAAGSVPKDRPANFLRRQETQALIAELGACSDSSTPLRIVNDGANNGTYACRELVIAYAAWISAAFHLRVIRVFLAQATPAPASVQADAQALAVAHTRAIEAAQAAAARVRRSVYRSMQQAQGAPLRMLVEVYPDESGDPHITARRLREGEEVLTPAELAEHVRRARVDELRRIVATLGAGLPAPGDDDTANPANALTVRR